MLTRDGARDQAELTEDGLDALDGHLEAALDGMEISCRVFPPEINDRIDVLIRAYPHGTEAMAEEIRVEARRLRAQIAKTTTLG